MIEFKIMFVLWAINMGLTLGLIYIVNDLFKIIIDDTKKNIKDLNKKIEEDE